MQGFALDLYKNNKNSFDLSTVKKYLVSKLWNLIGLIIKTSNNFLDEEWPPKLYTSLKYLEIQDSHYSCSKLLTSCVNL